MFCRLKQGAEPMRGHGHVFLLSELQGLPLQFRQWGGGDAGKSWRLHWFRLLETCCQGREHFSTRSAELRVTRRAMGRGFFGAAGRTSGDAEGPRRTDYFGAWQLNKLCTVVFDFRVF
jgi:hypothetical protein